MYIQQFLAYLEKNKKLSPNTLAAYRRDMQRFASYLELAGLPPAEQADKPTLVAYVLSMQKEGRANATIVRNVVTLRSFYAYLMRMGAIAEDPSEGLTPPKAQKTMPGILTPEEVERLLEQPDPTTVKGERDRAMLELLYATGIRVSELIALQLSDLNFEMGFVRCGERERIIPIGRTCVAALQQYIQGARQQLIAGRDDGTLFVNMYGRPLTRQGFWKIVKQYAAMADIAGDITPHTLRHSFAAHLLQNGADMKSIQSMMGHMDISSTQIYAQVVNSHLRDVYQKAHPRA